MCDSRTHLLRDHIDRTQHQHPSPGRNRDTCHKANANRGDSVNELEPPEVMTTEIIVPCDQPWTSEDNIDEPYAPQQGQTTKFTLPCSRTPNRPFQLISREKLQHCDCCVDSYTRDRATASSHIIIPRNVLHSTVLTLLRSATSQ